MSDRWFIMNTRTRHSERKPSEYYSPSDSTLIFIQVTDNYGRKRNVIAAQTYGITEVEKALKMIGERVLLTNDTGMGHRDMGEGEVIAVETPRGLVGRKELNAVGFWVFK